MAQVKRHPYGQVSDNEGPRTGQLRAPAGSPGRGGEGERTRRKVPCFVCPWPCFVCPEEGCEAMFSAGKASAVGICLWLPWQSAGHLGPVLHPSHSWLFAPSCSLKPRWPWTVPESPDCQPVVAWMSPAHSVGHFLLIPFSTHLQRPSGNGVAMCFELWGLGSSFLFLLLCKAWKHKRLERDWHSQAFQLCLSYPGYSCSDTAWLMEARGRYLTIRMQNAVSLPEVSAPLSEPSFSHCPGLKEALMLTVHLSLVVGRGFSGRGSRGHSLAALTDRLGNDPWPVLNCDVPIV